MIGSLSLQVHFAGSASVESWAKQFGLAEPEERALIERVRAWIADHFDPCIALTESALFHLMNDFYESENGIAPRQDRNASTGAE